MAIEAIEDHLRGWVGGKVGLSNERVVRGKFAIEHVMPRKWQVHWALPEGSRAEGEREALLHTLGNLTLLTSRLNSKVSNGPWNGEAGKKQALEDHCVLFLNRKLKDLAGDDWTDEHAFEAIGDAGVSVCVGDRPSHATFRLPDPAAVEAVLAGLATARRLG